MLMPSIFGENLFDEFFGDWDREMRRMDRQLYGKNAAREMKTDVHEHEDHYEVDIDLPGFKKEDITLELQNGYLTVTASKGLDKDETTKKGKGNVAVELTGHVSISNQEEVPMQFYSMSPSDDTLSIKLNKGSTIIEDGSTETLVATATSGATVAWASTDTTVATVTSGGVVTAQAEGVCVITAKATKSGESEIATCIVTVTEASDT